MCAISTLIVVSETRTVGIKSMSYHGLMIYNKLKFVSDSYKTNLNITVRVLIFDIIVTKNNIVRWSS